MGSWMIDDRIDLTAICKQARWHRLSIIDALVAANLPRSDAEAFADFAICEMAQSEGGICDHRPEDEVTDEQWERLSC